MAVRLQYAFDEPSGSTLLEASGGPSGTLSGVGSRVTGNNGTTAIQSSSGMAAGNAAGSPLIASSTWTAITVMCWVKRPSANGDFLAGFIVESPYNDMFGLKFGGTSANQVGGWIQTNVPNSYDTTAAHGVAAGTWMHVALTWSTAGTARIFANGVQIASGSAAGTAIEGSLTSIDMSGVRWSALANCPVDDVRVFDSAEDAASITSWMNTPVGGAAAAALPVLVMAPSRW